MTSEIHDETDGHGGNVVMALVILGAVNAVALTLIGTIVYLTVSWVTR